VFETYYYDKDKMPSTVPERRQTEISEYQFIDDKDIMEEAKEGNVDNFEDETSHTDIHDEPLGMFKGKRGPPKQEQIAQKS